MSMSAEYSVNNHSEECLVLRLNVPSTAGMIKPRSLKAAKARAAVDLPIPSPVAASRTP
jgi:hypothetical protein